jgi:hypothetical protein
MRTRRVITQTEGQKRDILFNNAVRFLRLDETSLLRQ